MDYSKSTFMKEDSISEINKYFNGNGILNNDNLSHQFQIRRNK